MANNSNGDASRGKPSAANGMGAGNAYGAYANAPTPFGPWVFQESRVVYSGHVELADGSSLGALQRRERPHLLLSAAGVPTHLYNGICLADGYGQSAKQPGHCFTFVQKISPGPGAGAHARTHGESTVIDPEER